VSATALRERSARRFRLGEEELSVRVRESSRAKTARIIVGPQRPLEVIVPAGVGDDEVDDLLEENRAWVERKVDAARTIAARPAQLGLDRPGVVWLDGQALPIVLAAGDRSVARLRDGRLEIAGVARLAHAALTRWYRREARRRIGDAVARESARLGFASGSLGIRDPRTRWGSCSRSGHLSFSWRLVMAPADVLDYVVVHELCHLKEPSHTKAFWRLLDVARPGWQEQARWLREHGQELHGYEPRLDEGGRASA
jgi:predicted metal-dependent hydrolase